MALSDATPLTSAVGPRSYLFYGGPGTGKTTAAARHKAKKKLWLDMDQKITESETIPNRETITVWQPHETLGAPGRVGIPYSPDPKNVQSGYKPSSKPMGYQKLVDTLNELLGLGKNGAFPYDLVVLDSLTFTSDHWTSLLMYTHNVSFMTERLWGIYLAGMKDCIEGFLQLPCERIIIAHDKSSKDEDTKQERIRPAVAGQLGDNLCRYFTEAYYFTGRERDGVYKLQTVSDRRISARTSRTLPADVVADDKLFG